MQVISHCDAEGLLNLRATSEIGDRYASAELSGRFTRLLGHFVEDRQSLVAQFAQSAAVVGGEAALAALYPDYPCPPYADVYTLHQSYADVVVHLESVHHYTLVPPDNHAPEALPNGVAHVTTLTNSQADRVVNVFQSTSSSPLLPLTSEWNTALFTYISPASFCVAYAALVRDRCILWNPTHMNERGQPYPDTQEAIEGWEDMGWDAALFYEDLPGHGECAGRRSPTCYAVIRSFGDSHCLCGPIAPVRGRLPGEGVPRVLVDSITRWRRGGPMCSPLCHRGHAWLDPAAVTHSRRNTS
ncbi:hypothetical protein C8Q76DRAFT_611458 [Earliella scabrosa]|nr:hypothetical protein C8Q76DRAFT_611458 [Earliella scabrosa]